MYLLWIDPAVRDYQVFVDSVNENTVALVYPEPFDKIDKIAKIDKIERIGFVFEKSGPMAQYLLENADLLIQSGVKHMDFLACDTLPEWQSFYDTLTGITVGASNNQTGNLQYGGDWLMESTCEDVEAIYFTRSIEYYKYLLDLTAHTMILDFSGNLWGCGPNNNGQLGLGNTDSPVTNFSFMRSNVSLFTGGNLYTVLLDFSGNLWGCGQNNNGQLGLGHTTSPVTNFSFMRSNVAEFTCGVNHTLVLDFYGNLWGCGQNNDGQLGLGNTDSPVTNFSFMRSNVSLFSGGRHTLVLDYSGNLWGCGRNNDGQLGLGNTTPSVTNFSFMSSNVADFKAGEYNTVILDYSGNLWGCGQNNVGQLGLGNTNSPVTNFSFMRSNVSAFTCGIGHILVLDYSGNLWGCGLNNNGQLGLGNTSNSEVFSFMRSDVFSFEAGSRHTLVLDYSGNLWGCGQNIDGRLGLGNTTSPVTNFSFIRSDVARIDSKNLYVRKTVIPTDKYASCYFGYLKATAGLHQFNLSDSSLQLRIGDTTLYDLRNNGPVVVQSRSTVQVTLENRFYPIVLTTISTSRDVPRINVSVNGQTGPLPVTLDRTTSGLYSYSLSPSQFKEITQDLLDLNDYADAFPLVYSPTWAYGNVINQTFWIDSSAIPLIQGPVPITVLNISTAHLDQSLTLLGSGFHSNVSVYLDQQIVSSVLEVDRILVNNASNFSQIVLRDGPLWSDPYSMANITSIDPFPIVNSYAQVYGTNLTNISSVVIGGNPVAFTLNPFRVKVPGTVSNFSMYVYDAKGGSIRLSLSTSPSLSVTTFSPTLMVQQGALTLLGANFSNVSAVRFGSSNASFVWNSSSKLSATVPNISSNCSISVYDIYDNMATYTTPFTYVEPFATCYFGYYRATAGLHTFNLSAEYLAQLRLGDKTLYHLRTNASILQLNAGETVQSATVTLQEATYPILLTYVNRYLTPPTVNVSFDGITQPLLPRCTLENNVSGLYYYNLSTDLLRETLDLGWPPVWDSYREAAFPRLSRIYSPDWAYGTLEEQTYWNSNTGISLIEGPVPVTVLNVSYVLPYQGALRIYGNGFHANVSVRVNGQITSRTLSEGTLTIPMVPYTTIQVFDGITRSNLFTGLSIISIDRTTAIRNSSVVIYGYNFSTSNIDYFQIGNTSTRAFAILSNTSMEVRVPASTQFEQPMTVYSPNGDTQFVSTFTIPPLMTVTSYVPTSVVQNAPLRITGSNFSRIAYVRIGQENASVTFNASNLFLTVPRVPGSFYVTVYDDFDNLGFTSTLLTVYKNLSVTSVANAVPRAPLQLTGTDFYDLSYVNFGGTIVPNTSFTYTPTQITLITPFTERNTTIGVYNQHGYNVSLSYTAVSTVLATTFTPNKAFRRQPVFFTGMYFADLSYVEFRGLTSTQVRISNYTNTSFILTLPEIPALSTLTVYDRFGNQSTYSDTLEYLTLSVTEFSPPAAVKGATLTLRGNNLSNLSSVTFVGTENIVVSNLKRIDDQQLTLVVPDLRPNPLVTVVPNSVIKITNIFGTEVTYSRTFEYIQMTVSEFTPSKAVPNNTVTLYGNNFFNISRIRLQPGPVIYVANLEVQPTQIRFKVPYPFGNSGILIYDDYGNVENYNSLLTILPIVNASSMPAQSVQRSTVAIQGRYFADLSDVYFGTENASYTYTDTQILAIVPDSTQINVSVVIRDQYTNTTKLSFTYIYPEIQVFLDKAAERQVLPISGIHLSDISFALFTKDNVSLRAYAYNVSNLGFHLKVPDTTHDVSGNVSVFFYDKYLNPLPPLGFEYINPRIDRNTSFGTTNWILTLEGVYLEKTDRVRLNGQTIPTYEKTANRVWFPVPIGSGNVSVELTDIYGNDRLAPSLFEYRNPKVNSMDGLVGRMGQQRVLRGEYLEYTSRILFGEVPQLGVAEPSFDNVVTVVPDVRDNVSVYAIDICGNAAALPGNFFGLGGNMSLADLSPRIGTTNTLVTIGGENIDFTDRVTFGRNASILFNSSTQIKCLVPPGENQVNVFVYDILNLNVLFYSTFTYQNPAITTILPIRGPNQIPVTIQGAFLNNTSTVYWGDTSIPFVPGESPSFTVPLGSQNTSIRVVDRLGNELEYVYPFQYENSSIESIQPIASPQNVSFTLRGRYLQGTTYIMFGDTPLSNQLSQIIPPGTGNVSVRTYDAYGNESLVRFTYTNPTITRFAQPYGTANMELLIEGEHLNYISSVTINGSTAPSRISSRVIFFTVLPGSDLATLELVNPYLLVTHPFEYRNPLFRDITPMGREGTPCVITGDHLQDVKVYLNDQLYPSQYTDSQTTGSTDQITFRYPPRGTYTVQLRSEWTTLNASSTISLGGAVNVTTIVPSSGPNNSKSVILGSNLGSTTQVWIGNASAYIHYMAEGYINVSIPKGTGEQPVTIYDVQNVSYPAFTYTYKNPNVSTLSPANARIGTTITLTGINLERSSHVLFQNRSIPVNKNNTRATFVVPNSSGNTSVILVDDVGNEADPFLFTYITPSITYFGDFSGNAGQTIYIYGEHLNYTETVKFGSRNASFFHEPDRLRIIVPTGQRQRWITLIDDGKNVMTYPTKFQYNQFSSIQISPVYGKPNASVQIQLFSFGNVSQVMVNGSVLPYTGEDILEIRMPELTGVVPVQVMDSEGEIMAAPFRYESIVLSEVTPSSGVAGTTLFIKGSKFSTVSSVKFDQEFADYTFLSDNLMKVTVPPNLPLYSKIFFYDSQENLGTFYPFESIGSTVESFTRSGRIGDLFVVNGQYLNMMKAITFNGIAAKDVVATETQVTCRIPYGVTSPDILMIDSMGTVTEIALRISDAENRFTYLTSEPQFLKNAEVQCVATDKGRLFVSNGLVVTSNGEHIYTHSLPILGMVVEDSIVYLCDGTIYIVRYNLATRRSLPRYTSDFSVIAIKRYQGILYALSKTDVPSLTVFGETRVTYTLPSLDYQGLAVDEFIYLTYLLPYDTEDPPPQIYGSVMRTNLAGQQNLTFLTGILSPKDILVVQPYLYVDGPFVYQYDLTQLGDPILYQTPGSLYSSMAYGQNQIYLANTGLSTVETIPAPEVVNTTVICSTITPKGLNLCLVEITGFNLDRIVSVLFDNCLVTNLVIASSTYLSFRAPPGTGSPVIHLLDENNQRIPHDLVFTYENVQFYQCSPRQGVEHQSLYLFGEHLDKVREVYIGGTRVDAEWVSSTLHVITPSGSGVAEIRLIDNEGNTITHPEITFSYNQLRSIICFQRGTLIYTDQGALEIQTLMPHVHTIYGQPIQAITATYYNDTHVIRIEPHALGPNCPSEVTVISKLHKIFYQGRMIPAFRFTNRPGFSWIPYDGDKLYNVLLYREGRMNVQGMICETLDPRNPVAEVFLRTN